MPQLHGKTYFRLEHYLPVSVLDKLNQTTIKEELPKLHSNYYGASDSEAEFEFLKVSKTNKNHGFKPIDQNIFSCCYTWRLAGSNLQLKCLFSDKGNILFAQNAKCSRKASAKEFKLAKEVIDLSLC